MLTSGVVLLRDKYTSAYSCSLSSTAGAFQLEMIGHLPYSHSHSLPTLSNNNLFTYLKNWLGSQNFKNNDELMEGVNTWLSSRVVDFFDTGIQKCIPQFDRCLSSSGVYNEK
jgi:hypothetical protein